MMKRNYLAAAGAAALLEALLVGCSAMGAVSADSTQGSTQLESTQPGESRMIAAAEGTDRRQGRAEPSAGEEPADGTEDSGGEIMEESKCQAAFKRMVMLDGRLYVETGETDSQLRCGMMDGNINSMTNGEIPTEDNQSNFAKDIGYQYGMRENRIEIYIEEEKAWCIFGYNENNLENFTMEVSEVSPTGCKVTFANTTGQDMIFGDDFKLEAASDIEGEWTYVPYVIDNGAFNSIAYPVENGKEREQEISWEWLYGTLSPGNYRIVKTVLTDEPGDYDKYTLSQEFVVE